jgi:hypothetical protein
VSQRRRFLAAVAAGALAVAVFGVTSAAASTVSITQPAEGARLEAPAVIKGSLGQSTETVKLSITAQDKNDRVPPPESVSPECSSNGCTFTWEPSLPYNGTYTVEAEVPGSSAETPAATIKATRTFALAIPPKTPTGVQAVRNPTSQVITVSWNANSEPDLTHYLITRTEVDDASSSRDFTVSTNSFVDPDSSTPGASYRYRVRAVREGADPSAPSAPADVKVGTTSTSGGSSSTSESTSTSLTPRPASPSDQPGSGTQTTKAGPSEFAKLRSQAAKPRPSPSLLPDTSFRRTLPFGVTPNSTGTTATLPAPASEGEEAALSTGSDGGRPQDRRALLIPVATGLVLFVGALHLRWLVARANETFEPF